MNAQACANPHQGFEGIGYQTSDEFIDALVRKFASMTLHKANYKIVLVGDGALRWSRGGGVERIGILWEPGMNNPLLRGQVRQRPAEDPEAALKRLRTGDPLQPRQQPRRPPCW